MSDNKNVLKPCEFDIKKINLSDPSKLPKGGYMIYVNNVRSHLYMQTPKVNVLWDCKYFADDAEGQSGKYTVQFSLTDLENNKKMRDFYDVMASLDAYVLDAAFENRKEWFGAKFAKSTKETLESLYTPMVKVNVDQETGEPDGKFPPRFAFKVVKRDGKHQCKLYDSEKNMFNIDDVDGEEYKSLETDVLVKGSSMNVVLKCNGIWVISGKFGCTWRAEQIKVKVHEKAISGYAFRDDDDDDDEDVSGVTSSVSNTVETMVQNVVNVVDDTDSDSDSGEEEASPSPAPTPVKKKRVVKKKA